MLKTNIEKLAVLKGLDKLIAYQDKTIKDYQRKLVQLEREKKAALWKLRK